MPFGASKVTMLGAAGGGSDPSWVMEVCLLYTSDAADE